MSAQLQPQTGALVESASLLDDIVSQKKVTKTDTEHARAKDLITELVKEVMRRAQ